MKVSDRDVMRLYDGDVADEEERRLYAARAGDPTVEARLAGLLQVSAFTRTWARERGVRAPVRAARRTARGFPLRLALGGAAVSLAALVVALRLAPDTSSAGIRTAPAGLPAAAVAVEQVDFGAHAGTIFSVSAAGTETTVVWLSEDADENSLAL